MNIGPNDDSQKDVPNNAGSGSVKGDKTKLADRVVEVCVERE